MMMKNSDSFAAAPAFSTIRRIDAVRRFPQRKVVPA
jgi:hypothetical protein